MSASTYLKEVANLLERLEGQQENIRTVACRAAETIQRGNWVRMFGSGHSVLPVMDTFPRYGGYPGFYPIMDPRVMWTCASGPGGAEEVLWLERQEGYMEVFLRSNRWSAQDMLIVISHGGQNAAPVEISLAAKRDGLYVAALTSMENHLTKSATHSSGKKIGDIADIIVDNCVSSKDAVVDVENVVGKIAGVSTLSAIVIMQSIVAETAKQLSKKGYFVKPFASPNTEGIKPNHNDDVYVDYRRRLFDSNFKLD